MGIGNEFSMVKSVVLEIHELAKYSRHSPFLLKPEGMIPTEPCVLPRIPYLLLCQLSPKVWLGK